MYIFNMIFLDGVFVDDEGDKKRATFQACDTTPSIGDSRVGA